MTPRRCTKCGATFWTTGPSTVCGDCWRTPAPKREILGWASTGLRERGCDGGLMSWKLHLVLRDAGGERVACNRRVIIRGRPGPTDERADKCKRCEQIAAALGAES